MKLYNWVTFPEFQPQLKRTKLPPQCTHAMLCYAKLGPNQASGIRAAVFTCTCFGYRWRRVTSKKKGTGEKLSALCTNLSPISQPSTAGWMMTGKKKDIYKKTEVFV